MRSAVKTALMVVTAWFTVAAVTAAVGVVRAERSLRTWAA